MAQNPEDVPSWGQIRELQAEVSHLQKLNRKYQDTIRRFLAIGNEALIEEEPI